MCSGLKDKIALITGASRGIGKAIALALAEKGCNIIINDLGSAKEFTEKVVEEIKKKGVSCMAVYADVSNYEAVENMVNEIKQHFSRVDILINNAGITKDRTLKKMSKEEWYDVINVNLNSIYNVTHLVLPLIPEGGRIISISSIVGLGGNFGQCNYAASKAGIVGFTKSLAKELGKYKITVNAIAPGFIKTKMTEKLPVMIIEQLLELIPMKEFGLPEDVAKLAVFLASDDSRYITGQVIRIDGGLGM